METAEYVLASGKRVEVTRYRGRLIIQSDKFLTAEERAEAARLHEEHCCE